MTSLLYGGPIFFQNPVQYAKREVHKKFRRNRAKNGLKNPQNSILDKSQLVFDIFLKMPRVIGGTMENVMDVCRMVKKLKITYYLCIN